MSEQNKHDRQSLITKDHNRILIGFGGTALVAALGIGYNLMTQDDGQETTPDAQSTSYKSYEDAIVRSSQVPLDRETETPAIDNIVVPAGMIPTEYIPNDPRYAEYRVNNPDEEMALETSLNSLKTADTNTYAVVERDVDGDGDTDAIVTQVEK